MEFWLALGASHNICFQEKKQQPKEEWVPVVNQEAIYAWVISLHVNQHDLDLTQVFSCQLTAYPCAL